MLLLTQGTQHKPPDLRVAEHLHFISFYCIFFLLRREFLKRCLSPKARESNPDCIVLHRVRSDDAPPVVAVEFGE